jgi:hypothetical protein
MRSLASASWVTKIDNESDEVEEGKKSWQVEVVETRRDD